jgi:hypothetical protein
MAAEQEKVQIEQAIERARDGVSVRIDELDRRLRKSLDFKSVVGNHAPQLIAGGVVLGFFLGFGLPRTLTKLVKLGVPVALAVARIRASMKG